MNKNLKIIIGILIVLLVAGAIYMYNKFTTQNETKVEPPTDNKTYSFRATVTDCNLKVLFVKPIEEKDEKILGDKVMISLKDNNDMLYMKGTELLISYTGDIMDTYPTQINVTNIETEMEYKKNIESLPEDYTLEQAVEDNCVVLTNNEKIYNKDELDRFIQNVNNNIPDFIRVVCFTVEGDMIITDIKFNNENNFKVCFDYTRDEYSSPEDRIYRYGKYTEFGEEKTEDGIYYYLDKPEDENLHKVYIAGYENDTEIINKKDSVK